MNHKEKIGSYIDTNKELFIDVSDKIWEYAELGFCEYKSSELICSFLKNEGFQVEKGLAGIDTAFVGSYGSEAPVIAVLGEYDALPGLSQESSATAKKSLDPDRNGHACGHNLLGAGALAAAAAVKKYLVETGTKGTIRYYGCPGEENGAGKTFMARDGCFRGTDIAFCWHPSDISSVWGLGSLANLSIYFRFHGISAHASMTPHLGRSALDAVELMNVGVNYLREHIIPEARVHYAITDPGGGSPNVVPHQAEVYYFIRSPKLWQAQEIYDRISDIAKGAALMTGTTCEIVFNQGLSDYIPNKVAGEVLYRNLLEAGVPDFDNNDLMLAEKFQKTLGPSDLNNTLSQVALFQGPDIAEKLKLKALSDQIGPFIHLEKAAPGSTDVGDVSYLVPTAQIVVACAALGTSAHSWQFTAQASSAIGHKGMLTAAKAIGMAAVEILLNPHIITAAKKELAHKTSGHYKCPIPDSIKPKTNINEYERELDL